MTDDSLISAFDRLEQAIARFEETLPARLAEPAAPAPAPASDLTLQARYDGLEARHEALRGRASAALERLDRLVGPARED